jgi:hypothetical protein
VNLEVGQKYYRYIRSTKLIQTAVITGLVDTRVKFLFTSESGGWYDLPRIWEIRDFQTDWRLLTPLMESLL